MTEANKVTRIMLTREMDRYARDFLSRHPEAVVVHIGCGLDSRFERVCSEQSDNGQVEWYDLDLPHVIELRREFLGDEHERYHLLGYSALEDAWLEAVSAQRQRPFLFLAEGVSMCFEGAQVKSLVLMLRDRFLGAELVFDAYSPIHSMVTNLQSARFASASTGESGTGTNWRDGLRASDCRTSGDSWTSLSHGWPRFAGCAPLNPCSERCASTASSLKVTAL